MNFIAMDFETASHERHSACSLALVKVENSRIVDEYYTLIQPETQFFWKNIQIHGIHPEDVTDAPNFQKFGKEYNYFSN
ncbi:exonuclease [Melissococcus plutonius]|nr:exonuclease [Melissococcus plutonius]